MGMWRLRSKHREPRTCLSYMRLPHAYLPVTSVIGPPRSCGHVFVAMSCYGGGRSSKRRLSFNINPERREPMLHTV